MSSSSISAVKSALRKEFAADLRNRQGLLSSVIFGVIAAVIISMPTSNGIKDPLFNSALLVLAMTLSASVAVPRIFLAEEERRTIETLRIYGDHQATFIAKSLLGLGLCLLNSVVVVTLLVLLTNTTTLHVPILIASVLAMSIALTATACLTGMIVMEAQSPWLLSFVVSLPFMVPSVFMGFVAFGGSLFVKKPQDAWLSIAALVVIGLALFLIGTLMAPVLWGLFKVGPSVGAPQAAQSSAEAEIEA